MSTIDWPAVHAAIAQLGVGEYQDGSSAAPGTTYHPMDWWPELRHTPSHKPDATRYDFWSVVQDWMYAGHPWPGTTVLDWGAANGYYSEGLRRLGADVFCKERDPASADLLTALGLKFAYEGIEEDHTLGVVLLMNVGCWLHKQGTLDDALRYCQRHSQVTYYQTATQASAGMYRMPGQHTQQDEERFLGQFFGTVTHVRDTTLHGGVRRLFRCSA